MYQVQILDPLTALWRRARNYKKFSSASAALRRLAQSQPADDPNRPPFGARMIELHAPDRSLVVVRGVVVGDRFETRIIACENPAPRPATPRFPSFTRH